MLSKISYYNREGEEGREMKELKLGIVSYTELADWFGISRIQSSQKEKKLEELKNFCRYELTKSGKVKILEIYESIYCSQKDRIIKLSEDYLKYFTVVRPGEYIGTAIQVAKDIIIKHNLDISPDYVARYISIPLKRDYGKGIKGKKGYRSSTWLKCSTDENTPKCEILTEKEIKDMKKIIKEIFKPEEYASMTENVHNKKELAYEEVQKIADERYLELYQRTKNYFKGKYYLVMRGTKLEDDAFIAWKNNEY